MHDRSDGQIELKATRENYERFMEFIESRLHLASIGAGDRTKILTACEEITINIINYAYGGYEGSLIIGCTVAPGAITITFTDRGRPFNPLGKPDTAAPQTLGGLQPGGFGIFIVRRFMDDVRYEYRGGQNILQLTKRIPGKA